MPVSTSHLIQTLRGSAGPEALETPFGGKNEQKSPKNAKSEIHHEFSESSPFQNLKLFTFNSVGTDAQPKYVGFALPKLHLKC